VNVAAGAGATGAAGCAPRTGTVSVVKSATLLQTKRPRSPLVHEAHAGIGATKGH